LQAEHVGTRALYEFGDQIDAQADGIDVPGGDFERHISFVTPGLDPGVHEAVQVS